MPLSVEHIVDPAYVAGIGDLPLVEVRAKREECQDFENALSYLRRLLHGRLDIVRTELELRRSGAEPADLDAIISRLPRMLAEGSRGAGLPRPPQDLAPGSLAEPLVEDLETRFPIEAMASVPTLSVDELADLSQRLADYEHDVSGRRQGLHQVIDALQEEIIRRYQAGDASVDSLLDG